MRRVQSRNVQFAGVDLAWKVNPPSAERTGVCIVSSSGRVEDLRLVTSDEELIHIATDYKAMWIGIDAPLIVPSEEGLRGCERMLFSRGLRLLPSSRSYHKRKFGGSRGEIVVTKLRELGFELPGGEGTSQKRVFEVYPHGLLSLIAGGKVPRYKRGRGVERRREALKVLDMIEGFEPSIEIPESLRRDVAVERAGNLPRVMDKIDALLSVLCVYSHWLYRGRRTELVGEASGGYIMLPRVEAVL